MRDFTNDHTALALNTATLGHMLDGHGTGWSPEQVIDACAARGLAGIVFWRREIGERAQEIGDRVRAAGLEVSSDLRLGLPSQAILEAVEEDGADLLVIGTRGLTGVSHLLLGSTAERVVQHATCPVLSVHPGDHEEHRRIRTVLVPTDFSRDAEEATAAATRLLAFALAAAPAFGGVGSERLYLSGTGYGDAVEWEFFCTEGRRSGVWTAIPVPSQRDGRWSQTKILDRGLAGLTTIRQVLRSRLPERLPEPGR